MSNKLSINFKTYMSGSVNKFRNKLNRIMSNYDKYLDDVIEDICKEIVKQCKERLIRSKYNVKDLVDNITYRNFGNHKFRVGVKDNEDKDTMYFLEFGTGVVGFFTPHPMAEEIGWRYMENLENFVYNKKASGYNSVGDFVGYSGWWYETDDPKKAHKVGHNGKMYAFTSGLKAVRYFYDTITEDNINKIVRSSISKYRNMLV